MSMPRRAMKEMGFQACCLRCDAEDVAASNRCKRCISRHTGIRDTLAYTSHDDPFSQFAKEMLMMAAEPHRHDHDEVHGEVLIEQQHLAAGLSAPIQQRTMEDVVSVFDDQKKRRKANVLRDVANQNEWNDSPPTLEQREGILEVFGEQDHSDYGARTIPSKSIVQVDRSERIGEDVALTDRLEAAKNAQKAPLQSKETVEKEIFEELQNQRKEWKKVLSEVDELLDDDN